MNPNPWSASCGKGNPKWTVGERSYKYINCSLMIREIKVGSTLHDFSQFSFLFFLLPFLFNIDSGSKLCDLLQSSQYIKICLWTKLKRNKDGFDMESVNDQWLQITRHCLRELLEWLAARFTPYVTGKTGTRGCTELSASPNRLFRTKRPRPLTNVFWCFGK